MTTRGNDIALLSEDKLLEPIVRREDKPSEIQAIAQSRIGRGPTHKFTLHISTSVDQPTASVTVHEGLAINLPDIGYRPLPSELPSLTTPLVARSKQRLARGRLNLQLARMGHDSERQKLELSLAQQFEKAEAEAQEISDHER